MSCSSTTNRSRIRGLKIRLQEFPEIEIIGECANGREAVKDIKAASPDLVFLDIQMPGLDGFGVVSALIGAPAPLIIFVTAYDKYAIDAFEANALDYLVKPVEEERLKDAVHRAREAIKTKAAASRELRLVELLASLSDEDRDQIKELIQDPTWTNKERYSERLSFKDGSKVVMLNGGRHRLDRRRRRLHVHPRAGENPHHPRDHEDAAAAS